MGENALGVVAENSKFVTLGSNTMGSGHLGPNQTMKLTATLVRFGDAFLRASFLSSQTDLCPSGRSLSCFR